MKEKLISLDEIRDKLGFSKKKFDYEIIDGEVKVCKKDIIDIPA